MAAQAELDTAAMRRALAARDVDPVDRAAIELAASQQVEAAQSRALLDHITGRDIRGRLAPIQQKRRELFTAVQEAAEEADRTGGTFDTALMLYRRAVAESDRLDRETREIEEREYVRAVTGGDPFIRPADKLAARALADRIELEHRRAQADAQAAERPRLDAPARKGPCPCGSGKKYKRCCGADVEVPRSGTLNTSDTDAEPTPPRAQRVAQIRAERKARAKAVRHRHQARIAEQLAARAPEKPAEASAPPPSPRKAAKQARKKGKR